MSTLLVVVIVLIVLNELASLTYKDEYLLFVRGLDPSVRLIRTAATLAIYALVIAVAIETF